MSRTLALLAALAALGAVAAAAYLALDANRTGRSLHLAAKTPRAAASAGGGARRAPARKSQPGLRLAPVNAFSLRLRRPPAAGLVFDFRRGETLWTLNPLRTLPIASLTKIMTAVVVVQRTRPDEHVRITRASLRYQGSGVGVLPKGKRVRLETLLNGLLLVSGNDAAIALAVHVAGSERRFVRLMNRRARQLGLRCTRFLDSHGLSRWDRSCPRDLAVLARLAMREPRIARIAGRSQVSFRFPIKGGKLYLSGHNPLIRAGYPGAIGLKTGYTNPAGRCFVGVAKRGSRTLGVVLLNSPNPPRQAPRLLDLGFRYEGGQQ